MFYIKINKTGHLCGPVETQEEAHSKGVEHYGTGNFTIEPIQAPEVKAVEKQPKPKA